LVGRDALHPAMPSPPTHHPLSNTHQQQELLASGLLVEVPAFSKFLHGSALLFPTACLESPPWFMPDAGGGGAYTPATADEMEGRGGGCSYGAAGGDGSNGWAAGGGGGQVIAGVGWIS